MLNLNLLNMPARRATIMPEIVAFFDDDSLTERFLMQFAGTTFTMPGPGFFKELRRDDEIIQELAKDTSIENRLRLMRRYRISANYLEDLWRIQFDKNLEAPDCPLGRKQAIKQAAGWMSRYPSLTTDIVFIFTLNARERAEAMKTADNPRVKIKKCTQKPKQKPDMTAYQAKVLRIIKRQRGGRATRKVISQRLKARLAPCAVIALRKKRFITELKCGDLKLTAKGRRCRV